MLLGPTAPTSLPPQNPSKLFKLAEWWWLGSRAMEKWAVNAKLCTEFLEGQQWSEEEVAALKAGNRAHFVFNKLAPLFRLMVGYHGNNQTEWTFQPGNDEVGTEVIADVLTQIVKQVGKDLNIDDTDSEVFQDGITTGRAYWDTRMSWEANDFGEITTEALDPFMVYPDPSLSKYDLNEGNRIQTSKFISVDEVEFLYGKAASERMQSFVSGDTLIDAYPSMFNEWANVSEPPTGFGEFRNSDQFEIFRDLLDTRFVNKTERTVRQIETQYYVRKLENVFIDDETGARATIPPHWGQNEIGKALLHAERIQNPISIAKRLVRRVRWCVTVGDLIVHDSDSPYETYTIHGFFPYFRRGVTRGMLHDLLDPQREINKRRNSEIESVTRNAGGGWSYHQDSMSAEQKSRLNRFGSSAGFDMEWGGGTNANAEAPKRIEAANPAFAAERLEDRARNDLRDISGFNEAALGELDQVQSGRALEARQRQAVLAVQMYLSNYTRSKRLGGRKMLELVQRHMRDERMFRIIGEDGQLATLLINEQQLDPESGRIMRLNDVTLGKYGLVVDETPLISTFANAQFEEAMAIMERLGAAGFLSPELAASLSDIVVKMSSLPQPQKDEISERIGAITGFGQQPGAAEGGVPLIGGPPQQGALPLPAPQGQQLLPAPQGVI